MKKPICIAVIGCGRIANIAHFPAFSAMKDEVRIKYACDLIPEKAEKAVISTALVLGLLLAVGLFVLLPSVLPLWPTLPDR